LRPAISPDRLAKALAYDRANLQKIIVGKRNIPKAKRGDFINMMKRYGGTV
jgi:plasmid maintenance system antidote protein VapI